MGEDFNSNKSKLKILVLALFLLGAGTIAHGTTGELELFNKGYEDYLSYHPEKAAEEFRTFLREFPGSSIRDTVMFWLGKSFVHSGNLAEAKRVFTDLMVQFPQSPLIHFVKGELGTIEKMAPERGTILPDDAAAKNEKEMDEMIPGRTVAETTVKATEGDDSLLVEESRNIDLPQGKEKSPSAAKQAEDNSSVVAGVEAGKHEGEGETDRASEILIEVTKSPSAPEDELRTASAEIPPLRDDERNAQAPPLIKEVRTEDEPVVVAGDEAGKREGEGETDRASEILVEITKSPSGPEDELRTASAEIPPLREDEQTVKAPTVIKEGHVAEDLAGVAGDEAGKREGEGETDRASEILIEITKSPSAPEDEFQTAPIDSPKGEETVPPAEDESKDEPSGEMGPLREDEQSMKVPTVIKEGHVAEDLAGVAGDEAGKSEGEENKDGDAKIMIEVIKSPSAPEDELRPASAIDVPKVEKNGPVADDEKDEARSAEVIPSKDEGQIKEAFSKDSSSVLERLNIRDVLWRSGDVSLDDENERLLYEEAKRLNIEADPVRYEELVLKHEFSPAQSGYLRRYLMICELIDRKLESVPEEIVIEEIIVRYDEGNKYRKIVISPELQNEARKGVPFEEIQQSYPDLVRMVVTSFDAASPSLKATVRSLQNDEIGITWSEEGYTILKPRVKRLSYKAFAELGSGTRDKIKVVMDNLLSELRSSQK